MSVVLTCASVVLLTTMYSIARLCFIRHVPRFYKFTRRRINSGPKQEPSTNKNKSNPDGKPSPFNKKIVKGGAIGTVGVFLYYAAEIYRDLNTDNKDVFWKQWTWYIHAHNTCIHTHTYIYIYVCVCVCIMFP